MVYRNSFLRLVTKPAAILLSVSVVTLSVQASPLPSKTEQRPRFADTFTSQALIAQLVMSERVFMVSPGKAGSSHGYRHDVGLAQTAHRALPDTVEAGLIYLSLGRLALLSWQWYVAHDWTRARLRLQRKAIEKKRRAGWQLTPSTSVGAQLRYFAQKKLSHDDWANRLYAEIVVEFAPSFEGKYFRTEQSSLDFLAKHVPPNLDIRDKWESIRRNIRAEIVDFQKINRWLGLDRGRVIGSGLLLVASAAAFLRYVRVVHHVLDSAIGWDDLLETLLLGAILALSSFAPSIFGTLYGARVFRQEADKIAAKSLRDWNMWQLLMHSGAELAYTSEQSALPRATRQPKTALKAAA